MDNKKPGKQSRDRRRGASNERRNDALSQLSFLGLDAQLATELQSFYQASLSEPMPESVQTLLARLSCAPKRR